MTVPSDDAAELAGRIAELTAGSWALAGLLAAVELGLTGEPDVPRTAVDAAAASGISAGAAERLLDVLAAAGLARRTPEGYVTPAGLAAPALRAELRSAVEQPHAMAAAARAGRALSAWESTDPVVLQAQGDASAAAVPLLEHRVFPGLDGVLERLEEPGASLLDVGAGVGALAIAMCRRWPALRAVALEPAEAPAALAAEAIAAARLQDRVQLRRGLVQDLADEAAYDLVWLPGNFLPPDVFVASLPAVLRALRPGGWLLMATLGGGGGDLGSATARLRASTWGGGAMEPEVVRDRLLDEGFVDLRVAPRLPGGLTPVFARRAPA